MNRAARRAAGRVAGRAGRVAAAGSAAVLATAGAGAVVMGSGGVAHANPVLTVTNTNNSGPGSLRSALLYAESTYGQDEIVISATGTVTLLSNLPDLSEGVDIVGPGSGSFTIDGQGSYDLLFFDSVSTGSIGVSGLTLTNANPSGHGIYVGSTSVPVTISDVVATGITGTCGNGFNFYSVDGTVTITDSAATGNSSAVCVGAGLFAGGNTGDLDLTITDSRFTDNETGRAGGGIYVAYSTVTIIDSVISGNTAAQGGGGLRIGPDSLATLRGVEITDNEADELGGGIAVNDSTLVMTYSTVSGNTAGQSGGGIQAGGYSIVGVLSSTISDNETDLYGGGLYLSDSGGNLIANSTISGNRAAAGGAMVAGRLALTTIEQSTITGNAVNGIPVSLPPIDGIMVEGGVAPVVCGASDPNAIVADPCGSYGTIELTGSIVAGNGAIDIGGWSHQHVTVDSDHSLLGAFDPDEVTVVDAGGTRTGVTAAQLALGPLADNGGPTLTHALLSGSIAVDNGPTTPPGFPHGEWDQRGDGYLRVVNGRVDVGAFEVQPDPPGPTPDPDPTFTG